MECLSDIVLRSPADYFHPHFPYLLNSERCLCFKTWASDSGDLARRGIIVPSLRPHLLYCPYVPDTGKHFYVGACLPLTKPNQNRQNEMFTNSFYIPFLWARKPPKLANFQISTAMQQDANLGLSDPQAHASFQIFSLNQVHHHAGTLFWVQKQKPRG